MSNKRTVLSVVIGIIIILIVCLFIFAPQITSVFTKKGYEVQKVKDATSYETIKKVEDTSRAMIASYQTDKLTYEQYKDSADEQEKTWAVEAKLRANRTATNYNSYILKNSFIWEDNIPSDINYTLEVVE